MEIFIHKVSNTNVNIFDWGDDNVVRCEFLTKKKPEVGDILMSHTKSDPNNLWIYKIVDILQNRDSRGLNPLYDSKDSFFKLKVDLVFNPMVPGEFCPEQYQHIDTSRMNNY